MIDAKKECDWEIPPYEDEIDGPDYCLWIERYNHAFERAPRLLDHPYLRLSGLSDPTESIPIENIAEIDELVARLVLARAWLEAQGKGTG